MGANDRQPDPPRARLLTFRSGGWVILLAALLTIGLLAWGIAPALLRSIERPPGDHRTIESYAFDLSHLQVDRDLIRPAMLHRDMVPAMSSATAHPAAEAQDVNDPKYGKYMVPSDLVIGVEIDGEARAYPLHVMYVHEIINDVLASTPIAVTYHWPCHSAMVFDRRVEGGMQDTAVFAHSGLVWNSNLLMYDRNQTRISPDDPLYGGGDESLWSQLQARAISGSAAAAGAFLEVLPSELVTWGDWLARHPRTTVVDRDLSMAKRYKDAAPTQYFQSDEIKFPVWPMPEGELPPKATVVAVTIDRDTPRHSRIYPLEFIAARGEKRPGGERVFHDTLGGTNIVIITDEAARTARVEVVDDADVGVISTVAYWFAWHAAHPSDELVNP